jgi:hypothetical protein
MYDHTYPYKEGEIRTRLEYDQDAESPDEMGDCEPVFFRAERGPELHRELEKEFPNPQTAYNTMAAGEIHKTKDGDWYFGVTEYRHAGSAFALAGSSRAHNFPDQQWDVIPIVGWIKITKQNRIDWGIHGKKGVEEKARANALGHLKMWEDYINGEMYGFIVEAFPYNEEGETEDSPSEEDSCWGFYGDEDAEESAKDSATWMAETLNWSKA